MVLTYSNTMSFKNCRKKFYFRNIREIVPKDRPLYFTTGGAIHKALELFYQDANILDITKIIDSYFGENKPDESNYSDLVKWNNDKDLAKQIIERYIKYYPSESFEMVAIENRFSVPIINPETGRASKIFVFNGMADGLVFEKGLYWLIEHKTTAQLNVQYKKKLTLDNQSIAYIEALQRVLDIKIQGVIYNVILKDIPSEPKVLKTGKISKDLGQKTSVNLYIKKIKELGFEQNDYQDFLDQYFEKEYFYREYITFSEQDLQEWRYELWDLQKNIQEAKKKNQYYKNTFHCVGFGTCIYWDICTAFDKEAVIEMSFQKREKNSELKKLEAK